MTIDNNGNILTTGSFSSSVDFDQSAGDDWHLSYGCDDSYLSFIDNDGAFISAVTWGGGDYDYGYGIACDMSNIIITGAYEGFADFDPGNLVDDKLSNGNTDAYLSLFNK